MGLAFISFHMPKGVGRPILALVSYFEQFYPLSSGLCGVLFIMLFEAVVAFESVKETQGCDSSNGRDVLYL